METLTVHELPKNLDPKGIETKWYAKWEDEKYFTPKAGKTGKSYCIIMPPPNVTGMLHTGHALDLSIQDIIIRFKRMKGFKTLYLPGMDHAGIATQAKVEELIYKTEKKTKHDLGREEFLRRTWKWKEEYGGVIAKQSRYLGISCDWDYFIFTMDEESNEAVRKAFCDLYNEGLIYQADYIVNWDPILQSAISDAEVEHKEVKGAFYHILYPVKDSSLKLEVATTRPETMFGDTAVAVNPNDERFKHLIGKKVILPLANKEIPIIADEHVDIEIGTGCLKVTPGHDFNDFEIGKRHNLEIVNILNKDGTLNEHGLEWTGLKCTKARPKVVERLEELGLFVKKIEHTHQVGHSQRSDAPVEPMVSKQWFLNVQEMSQVAMNYIKNDETRFYPKGWENTFFAWLKEPRNWCISRQLWWGHRIPLEGETDVLNVFVAPEFFWHGPQGPYLHATGAPDPVDHILERLAAEFPPDEYPNWVFVFGTAVTAAADDPREVFSRATTTVRNGVVADLAHRYRQAQGRRVVGQDDRPASAIRP